MSADYAARIGAHCIINSASIIEHDCYIGNFVHIGPGVVVCGNATVGDGVLIGANATILPGVSIGSWSIIGAGAVVTMDVNSGSTVAGIPAKIQSQLLVLILRFSGMIYFVFAPGLDRKRFIAIF